MRSRAAAPLFLLALVAGCAAPATAPAPNLSDYAITALALSTTCAARGEPFTVDVTVVNRETQNGTANVIVSARQFGHLVNEDVLLSAGETRALSYSASIDFAGIWTVYAIGATVPEVTLRVVENGQAC